MILLVGLNARFSQSNPALYYLREYCRDLSREIELIELSINWKFAALAEAVISRHPAAVCLSVYIWNTEIIKKLIPVIKRELPESSIILGGPEAGYNSEYWLQSRDVDYIIKGPGERSFRSLLENNLHWPQKLVELENIPFNEVPFPYRESDFEHLRERNLYYESSRGCPYRCSYCISSRRNETFQYREPGKVKEELSFMIRQKPKIIRFVDRTFNARAEHARDIWQYLMDYNCETKFHFEIHPGLLSEKDFQLLEKAPAGRFQFEIGIQSTNPETLHEINRSECRKDMLLNTERIIKLGKVRTHVDQIAGLPYEDMASIKNSFNQIYSLGADYFQLGFLKILAGTEIAEKTEEYGISYRPQSPYRVIRTRWLSEDELIRLKKIGDLINRIYNSNKFGNILTMLEPRFSTPFDFYEALSLYWTETGLKYNERDPLKIEEGLRGFMDEKFPSSREKNPDKLKPDRRC